MALCDSLQPVVLLSDIMGSNIPEAETAALQKVDQTTPNCRLFQVEQTEPLDLCLNGSTPDECNMVECHSDRRESGDDEDVVFVKKFQVNRDKTARKSHAQSTKGAPRRNPVRKARSEKRFKEEYTDLELDEDDFLVSLPAEDETSQENGESFTLKNEDCEDWRIEDVQKKRQRRRVFNSKLTCRLGRRRKINRAKENETKIILKSLESTILANLLLVKEYIDDIKTVNKLSTQKEDIQLKSNRIKNAVDIFKQQAILLRIAQETDAPVSSILHNIMGRNTCK